MKPPSPAARAAYRRHLRLSEKVTLAAEIVVTYVRARWWLLRPGLGETVAAMKVDLAAEPDGDQLLIGVKLGRIVGRTLGVLPADSRCLVRSLVLTSLLARREIQSSLVIGVRSEPEFEAHAWVECAGVPLLPPGDGAYERLTEL